MAIKQKVKRSTLVQVKLTEVERLALANFQRLVNIPNTSEAIRTLIRSKADEKNLWPIQENNET